MSNQRLFLMTSAMTALAAMPGQIAHAQEADERAETGTEIVVVARRREEALQDVPLAVTAVSAETLERRQIDSVAQVGQSIPNLTYQPGAPTGTGASTPSVFIRGIGSSETSLGTEPGVGLYVDDVYIARSVGSVLDLVDLESVQVLRGPQGTLFGRNSLGGAILIRTRAPRDEFGGMIEAKTGSFKRFDLRGSLDLPLDETFKVNVAGLYASRDGYVESLDSKPTGNINRYAGRATALWTPSSDLIRSAFPPIDLFEDIADPADWPLLISAEQKTNPRIMATIGNLDLVPAERRVGGAGATYLMAPFTHVSADRPSRFTNGGYGVLYVGIDFETALFETIHHHARFMLRTREAPGWTSQFREIVLSVSADLHDLRGQARPPATGCMLTCCAPCRGLACLPSIELAVALISTSCSPRRHCGPLRSSWIRIGTSLSPRGTNADLSVLLGYSTAHWAS